MEFFGINGSELLLILAVGVVLLGPRRAAEAVVWLRRVIAKLRSWSAGLREESTRTESAWQLNWQEIDPRNYDPRRIIKDAVAEEVALWMQAGRSPQLEQNPDKDYAADSDHQAAKHSENLPASLQLFTPQLEALKKANLLTHDQDAAPAPVTASGDGNKIATEKPAQIETQATTSTNGVSGNSPAAQAPRGDTESVSETASADDTESGTAPKPPVQ